MNFHVHDLSLLKADFKLYLNMLDLILLRKKCFAVVHNLLYSHLLNQHSTSKLMNSMKKKPKTLLEIQIINNPLQQSVHYTKPTDKN